MTQGLTGAVFDVSYEFRLTSGGNTITETLVEDGVVVTNKKGQPKKDTSKKDYERIQLGEDIEKYFEQEVKPYRPDAWMDRSKDRIGYEINFRKYFYEYKPLRSLEEITSDLLKLDQETEEIMQELVIQ